MFHPPRATGLLLIPLLLALPAAAQPADPAPAARPTLEGYQRFTDEKPVDWKQANDQVGRIGGWRAYAREAQQEQPPAPPAVPAAPPPAAPHAGHGKH